MKNFFPLVVFFWAIHACAAQPDPSFVTWLKQGMREHHIPGISIVVVQNYQIKWARGFGLADIQNNRPVTPDILFQAGSISKPVTAMAALKAVEEGKLTLDQPINEVLISWKIPDKTTSINKQISLRTLLSHSAGINVPGFIGYSKGEEIPTLVDVLKGVPPANSEAIRVTEPDNLQLKKFSYSGGGYSIVQQALVDLYQAFPETMDQLVLNPLHMTASTFQQPLPTEVTNIAIPYRPDGTPVPGGPHTYVEAAAAGLWTTPRDLAKYIVSIQKALRGDKNQVLSKRDAELLAVIPESRAANTLMGLGMFVHLNKEGKPGEHGTYFSHRGQNEGYRNLLVANIKNGNSIVIMTNMSPAAHEPEGQGWDFIYAIEKKLAKINKW